MKKRNRLKDYISKAIVDGNTIAKKSKKYEIFHKTIDDILNIIPAIGRDAS